MSAFLKPSEVVEIFNCDLFSSKDLESTFLAILGLSANGVKPFECIGTPEESLVALDFALRQHQIASKTGDHHIPSMLLDLCSWGQIDHSLTSERVREESLEEMVRRRSQRRSNCIPRGKAN